jgi:hypothetical protein
MFICEGKLSIFHSISNDAIQMDSLAPVTRLRIRYPVFNCVSDARISVASDTALFLKDEHLLLSFKENQRIMLRKIKCRIDIIYCAIM